MPRHAAALEAASTGAAAQPAAAAQPTTTAPSTTVAPPAPAAAAPDEDIRDIRGPKFILSVWFVAVLLAGAALLGLLGYAVWRWLHRRRRPRALLSFELALQRLEQIRTLLQPGRAREFSTEVSDIIRSYIEARFDVTATHQTTEEFLRDLLTSSNTSLARHRSLLSAFLNQCDLVKFAGMSLTLQSMESLHASARTFVLETAKPDDAPQAAPVALQPTA